MHCSESLQICLIIYAASRMAGRLGPGLCLRLWAEKAVLADAPQPEILDADLASLALALALRANRSAVQPAGCGDQGPADPGGAAGLRWLDAPPVEALAATQALLRLLGVVDAAGMATAAGAPRSLNPAGVAARRMHLRLLSLPV